MPMAAGDLLVRYATAQKADVWPKRKAKLRSGACVAGLVRSSRDGRVEENPTLGFTAEIGSVLLPQLPADRQQRPGRVQDIAADVRRSKYSLVQPRPVKLVMSKSRNSMPTSTSSSLSTAEIVLRLTQARGLVDRVDFRKRPEVTRALPLAARPIVTRCLRASNSATRIGATAVAVEMSDYFAVEEEYDELVEQAGKQPARRLELIAPRSRRISTTCARPCRPSDLRAVWTLILRRHDQCASRVKTTPRPYGRRAWQSLADPGRRPILTVAPVRSRLAAAKSWCSTSGIAAAAGAFAPCRRCKHVAAPLPGTSGRSLRHEHRSRSRTMPVSWPRRWPAFLPHAQGRGPAGEVRPARISDALDHRSRGGGARHPCRLFADAGKR